MENKPGIHNLSLVGFDMPIKALDGTRLIGSANNIFKLFISSDFLNVFFSKKSKAASQAGRVRIFRLKNTGFTLARIFSGLGCLTWKKRVLTQDQVVEICSTYSNYFENNFSFFLCKKDENRAIKKKDLAANLFVILVQSHIVQGKPQLAIYSLEFNDPHVWKEQESYQFVFPEDKPFDFLQNS